MKDDDLYLRHILEAIERALTYAQSGQEAFRADLKTQDAVIHNIQIIGEATKKISPELRATQPDVPWRNMAGLRDRIVHDYFGVSLEIVWDVVESHLPKLREAIRRLVSRD